MDDQQDNVAPKCEESWFDVANLCGKEFELPNISTPLSPNSNLVFSQYQLLDTPPMLENAFVFDTNNLFSTGNQLAASPIKDMVPPNPITNTVPVINHQEGNSNYPRNSSIEVNSFVPIFNHQTRSPNVYGFEFDHVHVPLTNKLVYVPSYPGFSWNGLDIDFPLRNQQVHVANPINLPCFNSIGSLCLETYPTYSHGSININATKFGSYNHYIPTRSQISHVGIPSNNHIVNNHALFPIYGPPHVPAMTNIPGNKANESYIEDPNPASQSYDYGPAVRNQQAFGSSSLLSQTLSNVARKNHAVKHVCKECNKVFPTYSSFGGHMSFHARIRNLGAKLSSQRDALLLGSLGSSYLLGAADKKIEGNNFLDHKTLKKRCYQSHERVRQESYPLNANEIKSSPLYKILKTKH
uniref:C2H2-type domain-containing protein n=1 Tax=Fagus sylvatica TaxID=28930 RepID=A0A2N9GET0_FAGSY